MPVDCQFLCFKQAEVKVDSHWLEIQRTKRKNALGSTVCSSILPKPWKCGTTLHLQNARGPSLLSWWRTASQSASSCEVVMKGAGEVTALQLLFLLPWETGPRRLVWAEHLHTAILRAIEWLATGLHWEHDLALGFNKTSENFYISTTPPNHSPHGRRSIESVYIVTVFPFTILHASVRVIGSAPCADIRCWRGPGVRHHCETTSVDTIAVSTRRTILVAQQHSLGRGKKLPCFSASAAEAKQQWGLNETKTKQIRNLKMIIHTQIKISLTLLYPPQRSNAIQKPS